jgi:sulfur carrier protein ThiS
MSGRCATTIEIEVVGHLIFYLARELRKGTGARVAVPVGTTVGNLPELLGIPRHEIQAVLVNGAIVADPSATPGPKDQVVVLPVISGG